SSNFRVKIAGQKIRCWEILGNLGQSWEVESWQSSYFTSSDSSQNLNLLYLFFAQCFWPSKMVVDLLYISWCQQASLNMYVSLFEPAIKSSSASERALTAFLLNDCQMHPCHRVRNSLANG